MSKHFRAKMKTKTEPDFELVDVEPVEVKTVLRDEATGRLLKGSAPLTGCGRPKHNIDNAHLDIMAAIKTVETEKGIPWLKHQIKKSYKDTKLAVAILRKIYPDLKSIDDLISLRAPVMSDEEAEGIREKMKTRFLAEKPAIPENPE